MHTTTTTTTSFFLQTILLLVLVILPSTMAQIPQCQSCGCWTPPPPVAAPGSEASPMARRHSERPLSEYSHGGSGYQGNVAPNHDPSKHPGSPVHPPEKPCNYPGQAGCPRRKFEQL